jgi:ApaG protein
MSTLITSGVQISVATEFRSDLSDVHASEFFFNYHIEIQNMNHFDVQLLSRDWYIFDSLGSPRYVTGEGVIGEQPLLKPEESFKYTSGCDLHSELGMMKGFYTFKNVSDDSLFEVFVPTFLLEYPNKLN